MLRGLKIIVRLQPREIGYVFELAVSVRSIHREGPITVLLGSRTRGQTNEKTRDILSGKCIADEELFGGPWLRHLRDAGDPGVLLRSVRERGIWIRSRRGDLDLGRGFRRRGFGVPRAENPSRPKKNHQQYREKRAHHADGGIIQGAAARAGRRNSRYL